MKAKVRSPLIFLLIGSTVLGLGVPQSAMSATKKKSKKSKPVVTKPKVDVRLFNMCEAMDQTNLPELFPGKTLEPIYFLNGPNGRPVEGGWRNRDLKDEATYVTSFCRVEARDEKGIITDQLNVAQDQPIAPARERQARIKNESTVTKIAGVSGKVWVLKELRPSKPNGIEQACLYLAETSFGVFQASHGVRVPEAEAPASADELSCDLAAEVLRRTLSKIESGSVSKLPAPK